MAVFFVNKELVAKHLFTMQCAYLGEAQKKLDELEDQKSKFDSEVMELKEKCTEKQRDIDDINLQIAQHDRLEQVNSS